MEIKELFDVNKIVKAYETLGRQESYLHEILMPARQTDNFNITTIVEDEKVPVAIRPSNFDADPISRRFGETALYDGKKLYFKENYKLREEDRVRMFELLKMNDGGVGATNFANYRIAEFANWLEGVRLRAEILGVSLLTTGKVKVNQDGVLKEIDYKLDATHKKTTGGTGFGSAWTNPTAKPLSDILKIAEKGSKYVIMTEKTYKDMLATDEVKTFANKELNLYMPTEQEISDAIFRKFGINLIVYKTKGKLKETGTTEVLFPDNFVSFIAPNFGFTSYAPTVSGIDSALGLSDGSNVAVIPKTGGATVKTTFVKGEQATAISNFEILVESMVAPDEININKLYTLDVSV